MKSSLGSAWTLTLGTHFTLSSNPAEPCMKGRGVGGLGGAVLVRAGVVPTGEGPWRAIRVGVLWLL